MGKTFSVPAVLEGISPLKDGGMSIRFHTQEVKKTEQVTLLEYYQGFGWLQFSDSEVKEPPIDKPLERGNKTPSQRLRAVLFVLWQQNYSDEDFDQWYRQRIEAIIDKVKESLE